MEDPMTPGATWPTGIDASAPVISRRSLAISAPRQRLWTIHTDVAGWPRWQEDITFAQLHGSLTVGGSFSWRTKGLDVEITSRVYALEPVLRTLWGGAAAGIMGVHEWAFEDGGAHTIVATAESWSGVPVEQNVARFQAALDESLDRWLRLLKSHAES